MSQFIENAREIFETAENSVAAGNSSEEYTILLGSAEGGGIRMIANSDWSLGALQEAHGAQQAYRVSRLNGRVVVDGCDRQRSCHMEGISDSKTAQFLLNSVSAWHATQCCAGLLA